ncbi:MAG TPA: DEAD/DEAH box helicase [Bacteroidia bacterium]|jgi:ATP-dependent RNA helicase RhlE|nr:DEAD/DEAH box helicase [Bacteroidia bacterium]
MTFQQLNLIAPLLDALSKQGYSQPTPIQEKAIPHVLEGRDIFGCAQTGTGKTAAFALPILQFLEKNKATNRRGIKALILAPTRELALQINESFSAYGKNLRISHTVIFGGVSQHAQTTALRKGVDIVVATPGRLLDLMQQGHVKLQDVQYFILDEADRMLDMGFINDIKKIISRLPAKRQTILFSATAPAEIRKFADTLLRNPVSVNITPVTSTSDLIKQSVYYVSQDKKKPLLKYVLINNAIEHALVFTRTKRGADKVVKELNKNGIKAEAIHGDKSQGARERALKGFKNRAIRVLVATDIASRGIDVDKLTHVINFEIPEQAETYVHRIGRTGRAGESGNALSFCNTDEREYMKNIHKLLKNNIEVVSSHPFC